VKKEAGFENPKESLVSISKSINQSTNQSTNQSINKSSINQQINQSINKSINIPIHQSKNQNLLFSDFNSFKFQFSGKGAFLKKKSGVKK